MMRKTKVDDLESEIHGYMPQTFVMMYYELVTTSLKQGVDSIEKSRRGMGVTRGTPPGSEGAVLLSEVSVERKRVIDRKLREIARETPSAGRKVPPKCLLCGHFGSVDWKFCATCGVVWGGKERGEVGRVGERGTTGEGTTTEGEGTGLIRGGVASGAQASGAPVKGGQRWVQLR